MTQRSVQFTCPCQIAVDTQPKYTHTYTLHTCNEKNGSPPLAMFGPMLFIVLPLFPLLGFLLTRLLSPSSNPVQLLVNREFDKHLWWFLDFREQEHTFKRSADKCENLLYNGHWEADSFNISGVTFDEEKRIYKELQIGNLETCVSV